jgi:2-polyprenyl-3-methyl-5-hydroxy-6-metoxy-1,4-benzoquinol methylase
MKSKVQYWEGMYSRPLEELPWEIPKPPKELSDFLGTHNVKSGTALDIGCGTGNYSLFLAKKGFQVTGIDFSTKALAVARRRARQNALKIKLVRAMPPDSLAF